jgi:hypothetical protein
MLQVFCDLSLKDTFNIPLSSFDEVIGHLLNCLNEDTPFINKFSMDGKDSNGDDITVTYGFIPNLDKITFGEFIDLDKYINDWDNMHKAMSILYRPIIHQKKEFYRIEDYQGTYKHSNVMRDMPVNVVIGALVFFYRLSNKLPSHTLDYFLKEIQKKGEQTPQVKQILEKNGDTFNQYILLLKEMSEGSMKLQVPLYTNV